MGDHDEPAQPEEIPTTGRLRVETLAQTPGGGADQKAAHASRGSYS